MMKCTKSNNDWKSRGVDRVVLLEPHDLSNPNVKKIEMLGYKIGAVINQGNRQVIVIQLPGIGNDNQVAFPVLELEESLESISLRWRNAH